MIYELFYPLKFHYPWLSWLNVLRYIPFRTIMATITAMVLTFMLAPWFIRELRRISTPGLRKYVAVTEIPRVRNGLGMAILSTSQGVMSDRQARQARTGGELLALVW